MVAKKISRSYHKGLRDRMTRAEREEKSREICRRIALEPWYSECGFLYGYYPIGSETNCLPILQQALSDGKRVALPKSEENGRMDFYEIRSLAETAEGMFHVREPLHGNGPLENTEGVILTPGLAFDRLGNRCGYGKGYYDRYFARFPTFKRFGLAFENQMEERIETDTTDIKLHRVYTEKRCYFFCG